MKYIKTYKDVHPEQDMRIGEMIGLVAVGVGIGLMFIVLMAVGG